MQLANKDGSARKEMRILRMKRLGLKVFVIFTLFVGVNLLVQNGVLGNPAIAVNLLFGEWEGYSGIEGTMVIEWYPLEKNTQAYRFTGPDDESDEDEDYGTIKFLNSYYDFEDEAVTYVYSFESLEHTNEDGEPESGTISITMENFDFIRIGDNYGHGGSMVRTY